MQRDHISVPTRTLSTATTTIHQLMNQISLCHDALAHHSDGSATFEPIIETLSTCASDLQHLRSDMDILVSTGGAL